MLGIQPQVAQALDRQVQIPLALLQRPRLLGGVGRHASSSGLSIGGEDREGQQLAAGPDCRRRRSLAIPRGAE